MPSLWLDPASAANEHERLVFETANRCARWFQLSGSLVKVPFQASDLSTLGDSSKAGLRMAAVELRDLLSKTPDGRKALRNLGFEPVFEDVERE